MNSAIHDKTNKYHIKPLERDVMIVSAAKSQTRLTYEEKLKSSYESIFSDVVTPCYVRGYN